MLTNKYLQLALSAGVALFGWASATDWTTIASPHVAAGIAGTIGILKLGLNALSPAPGQTVLPTGNSLVTHKVD